MDSSNGCVWGGVLSWDRGQLGDPQSEAEKLPGTVWQHPLAATSQGDGGQRSGSSGKNITKKKKGPNVLASGQVLSSFADRFSNDLIGIQKPNK